MNTLEMMNEALKTEAEYITGDMIYSTKRGFTDSIYEPWNANAFDSINEIMEIDDWKLKHEIQKEMTLEQIEKKLGYRIKLVSK